MSRERFEGFAGALTWAGALELAYHQACRAHVPCPLCAVRRDGGVGCPVLDGIDSRALRAGIAGEVPPGARICLRCGQPVGHAGLAYLCIPCQHFCDEREEQTQPSPF